VVTLGRMGRLLVRGAHSCVGAQVPTLATSFMKMYPASAHCPSTFACFLTLLSVGMRGEMCHIHHAADTHTALDIRSRCDGRNDVALEASGRATTEQPLCRHAFTLFLYRC
jgi:hypothetical protein